MEKTIGFSTGAVYQFADSLSEKTIKLFDQMGCTAIEINWHKNTDILNKELNIFLSDCSFEKITMHLPSNIKYSDNFATFNLLLHAFYNFPCIYYFLFHPDLIEDWRILRKVKLQGVQLTIENMDNRKKSFRTLDSLNTAFLNHPNFGLVFDVNHWIVNGNSIESIQPTIQTLTQNNIRICGIHLSGTDFHQPLFKSNGGKDIIKSLSIVPNHIPIIIESILKNEEELKKEWDFINKHLT